MKNNTLKIFKWIKLDSNYIWKYCIIINQSRRNWKNCSLWTMEYCTKLLALRRRDSQVDTDNWDYSNCMVFAKKYSNAIHWVIDNCSVNFHLLNGNLVYRFLELEQLLVEWSSVDSWTELEAQFDLPFWNWSIICASMLQH